MIPKTPQEEEKEAADAKVCAAQQIAGLRFTYIPPGSFMMGGGKKAEEKPAHRVTISHGYCMAIYETTWEQWRAGGGEGIHSLDPGDDRYPVVVRWIEAEAFAAQLRKKTGIPFRLPWEAEWEYAGRAGSETPYSFGSRAADLPKYGNCGSRNIEEVGRLQPNAWGLYDMHGNVSEWVADWFKPYDHSDAVDPKGADSGETKVARGGDWNNVETSCTSTYRTKLDPKRRQPHTGFRLIFELP